MEHIPIVAQPTARVGIAQWFSGKDDQPGIGKISSRMNKRPFRVKTLPNQNIPTGERALSIQLK